MKFYIRPEPCCVLSFDLDDTLYDNRPVIRAATVALTNHLCSRFAAAHEWQDEDWLACKRLVLRSQPELLHDTTACREAVLTRALTGWGFSGEQLRKEVEQAMECFVHHRSNFKVSDDVLALLAKLDEKYMLAGITNGNVDAARIGLTPLLRKVVHPGKGIRKKPFADMFRQVIDELGVAPANILHVGDSWQSDVQGARRTGCQAAWLNPAVGARPTQPGSGCLPHMELRDLSELLEL
ncbi:MAG: HAD-IA family hydrolase [Shewanella sp.]|nr:HAD-IA family hydrolase [Shewanella sp.]MCF1430842.1 HAD-IA family hydrolase [Shewanella sp.]MCF1437237.1 HAD-IA family hydrolase [Shewanella sp.]MCF1456118.1 HAD-IA family hydrolase [Shewanella sp.]